MESCCAGLEPVDRHLEDSIWARGDQSPPLGASIRCSTIEHDSTDQLLDDGADLARASYDATFHWVSIDAPQDAAAAIYPLRGQQWQAVPSNQSNLD